MKQTYGMLPEALIPWYRTNARDLPWRKDKEPYHVWLSEIMLQQTRVEAVKGYYSRFLAELPDIPSLAKVEESRLLKLWEGLGYYNRARNLQKAAKVIITEHMGAFPSEYREIISLPGIGEYTAGAIASTCFDQPVAAVDGNVTRVLSRIMESYEDVLKPAVKKQMKQDLEAVYPQSGCGEFTQALMELGAIVCVPNGKPKCEICPAGGFCLARRNKTQLELPVKIKKKDRRIEAYTVFALHCQGKTAVRRREDSGLLAGLWELPNIPGAASAQDALRTAEEWGCGWLLLKKQVERKHIFTHVQWDMTCFYLECGRAAEGLEWVDDRELHGSVPLPTAFRQFLGNNFNKND
ncbi:MAG: A/G-specific adenine glycosylase [Firmicutes bacterium]|nr:A/G-specific adenine glycosylase [Bacillota bacterium]NBI63612.1 A/G-specific adenine glycosylase [Clostridiales bacterium]